jgi:hypothetical protein
MSLKIHPGIGIARLGNSLSRFVGPTTAAETTVPTGFYKDPSCRIQRQGARFQIWEYASDGTPLAVLGAPQAHITWTVQVAATGKSPAPTLSIAGPNQSVAQAVAPFVELETDASGNLVVYTGVLPDQTDVQEPIGTGDGWVQAIVSRPNLPLESALTSSVVLAPPDFAPAMRPIVSVYDQVSQLLGFQGDALTSFRRHVFPILRAGSDLKVVRNQPPILTAAVKSQLPFLSGQAARQAISALFGAGEFALTAQQTARLNDWIEGTFTNDFADLYAPLPETPLELDKGPLDRCLQQATGWDVGPQVTTRADFYLEPFRLDPTKVPFGFSRSGLAASWEGDLMECTLVWPSQATLLTGNMLTADDWATRGFVERTAPLFGDLFVDGECGALPTQPPLPVNAVLEAKSGNRILILAGGGLGDGWVLILTPHGPVPVGPGDPLHPVATRAIASFTTAMSSIASQVEARGTVAKRG